MTALIGIASYGLCGLGFLILTALLAVSRTGGWFRTAMALASGLTMVWAMAFALSPWLNMPGYAYAALELGRDAGWLLVVDCLIRRAQSGANHALARWLWVATLAVAAGLIFYGQVFPIRAGDAESVRTAVAFPAMAGVLIAIAAVVMIENLFRNAGRDARWAFKYFCFALGLVFAYDFLYYADSLLFRRASPALFDARGFVNAMIVPFLAVATNRAETWNIEIHVSRKVVFHSFALIGSGLYLLVMAAAGFYLREFGGDWGTILQIVLVAAALLGLLVVVSSGSLRARVKVLINKHFFSYKYDYREEWLRFITAMSSTSGSNLHDRVIHAVADMVHSNAGSLWVLQIEDNAYFPTASWNLGDKLPAVAADSPLVGYLTRSGWVIDLDQWRHNRGAYENLSVPDWLVEHPRAWLIVPLLHREVLHGFLVLGETRGGGALDWEDFDLLKTVGRQVASYLAEEKATDTMVDALRLEAFNRRFAFVVHDIKNLTSQMSLMLKNAERFGDRPEFQQDMLETVRNSVTRMKALLEQLNTQRQLDNQAQESVPLADLLEQTAAVWRKQITGLDVQIAKEDPNFLVDSTRLSTILDHLLQNALEAAGETGEIALHQVYRDGEAIIEVRDNGPGMDEIFVRDDLFSPLNSKKSTGYGLGAYQTRQLVREMGGRLEVQTAPGEGTTMRIVLPAIARAGADRQADRQEGPRRERESGVTPS